MSGAVVVGSGGVMCAVALVFVHLAWFGSIQCTAILSGALPLVLDGSSIQYSPAVQANAGAGASTLLLYISVLTGWAVCVRPMGLVLQVPVTCQMLRQTVICC